MLDKFKITVHKPQGNCMLGIKSIFKFSGGEIQAQIESGDITSADSIDLYAYLLNSDDIMTLIMLTDALRRLRHDVKINLVMPYAPYARQDRVCNAGEALGISAFAKIINSMEYNAVYVSDPHSDVSPAVLDRCHVRTQAELFLPFFSDYDIPRQELIYLVSPDAGAAKKTRECFKLIKMIHQNVKVVYANKVRNTETGEITETNLAESEKIEEGAHFIVVDDICDGGRTFIDLGKVLKTYKPKSLRLHVTHGIFSKGEEVIKTEGCYNELTAVYKFSNYKD